MIVNAQIIKNAVELIKEKLAPEKIFLFGSYAKGNPTEDSDLDFLIIQKTNLPKHQRVASLYALGKTQRIGAAIGVDFLVYTPEEFEMGKHELNSIIGEVFRTGIVMYAA